MQTVGMAKRVVRRMAAVTATALYFGVARHLPSSSDPLGRGLTNPFRARLVRFMFNGKCGRHITVERGAWFGFFSIWGVNMQIGEGSGIGINARLEVADGLVIGENVMIGPDVVIYTGNHRHDDVTRPMVLQGGHGAPVVIEDDVWIEGRGS